MVAGVDGFGGGLGGGLEVADPDCFPVDVAAAVVRFRGGLEAAAEPGKESGRAFAGGAAICTEPVLKIVSNVSELLSLPMPSLRFLLILLGFFLFLLLLLMLGFFLLLLLLLLLCSSRLLCFGSSEIGVSSAGSSYTSMPAQARHKAFCQVSCRVAMCLSRNSSKSEAHPSLCDPLGKKKTYA